MNAFNTCNHTSFADTGDKELWVHTASESDEESSNSQTNDSTPIRIERPSFIDRAIGVQKPAKRSLTDAARRNNGVPNSQTGTTSAATCSANAPELSEVEQRQRGNNSGDTVQNIDELISLEPIHCSNSVMTQTGNRVSASPKTGAKSNQKNSEPVRGDDKDQTVTEVMVLPKFKVETPESFKQRVHKGKKGRPRKKRRRSVLMSENDESGGNDEPTSDEDEDFIKGESIHKVLLHLFRIIN